MPVYTYQPVTARRMRRGKCPVCGKSVTRTRTFQCTINPFNLNDQGPNGTGPRDFHINAAGVADRYRQQCQTAAAAGKCTFRDILLEEVFEAMAEEDPDNLRTELIQVAAVAVAWIEKIDRDAAKKDQ